MHSTMGGHSARARLRTAGVAVATAVLVIATVVVGSGAQAETPPPPLGDANGNLAVRLSPANGHPFADLADLFANGCDPAGTSTMLIAATGSAYSTAYTDNSSPGTFEMSGTATLGPQTITPGYAVRGPEVYGGFSGNMTLDSGTRGQLLSLDVTFTIHFPGYVISGTQTLSATSTAASGGLCDTWVDRTGTHWAVRYADGPVAKLSSTELTYEATIDGPEGVWIDSGTGRVEANHSDMCVDTYSTNMGSARTNWCTGGLSEYGLLTFTSSDGVQPGDPDRDGDGIPNELDPMPDEPSTVIQDPVGPNPTHFAEILATGSYTGPYEVVDLPGAQGFRLTTGGSTGDPGYLHVRVCGGFTMWVPPATAVPISCGSLYAGPVEAGGPVQIRPLGEADIVITAPVGTKVYVTTPDANEDFTVEVLEGTSAVSITKDGTPLPDLGVGGTLTLSTNAPPMITSVVAPMDPTPLGQAVELSAGFEDPGVDDVHECVVDWGDGTTSPGTVGGSQCDASHTYAAAGVFNPVVTITDDAGDSDSATASMVVVFDPEAGFVTGGGHFDSPAGAFKRDATATGKATFGFVSAYRKGQSVPTGNTHFQFKAGDLTFHSDAYDWLVVTGGDHAQFRGAGTINGDGGYSFRVWASDATPDTFRIQIWSDSDVVYDNGVGQPIAGGSIVVHQ